MGKDDSLKKLLRFIKDDLDNQAMLLFKVPEHSLGTSKEEDDGIACIIDLETTGLHHDKDEITEIGAIKFSYCSQAEIPVGNALATFEGFNDPLHNEITQEITQLTGITKEMVSGHKIDLEKLVEFLQDVDLIICHNASFDRKFLEQLDARFKVKRFGCTKNDVNWRKKGYGANKLDYLNWKMGYFYDAHRALNDCWATLNLLMHEEDALHEILEKTKSMNKIFAINTPYAMKDELKANGFMWDATRKQWYKTVLNKEVEDVEFFLGKELGVQLKIVAVPANKRYSIEEL